MLAATSVTGADVRLREFRNWLEETGMPLARAAEMFGVARKTVDRWVAGESDIPPSIGTECYLLSGHIRLYQLRPLRASLASVHWRASTYQGTLNVRAPNERLARMFAAKQYGRSGRRGGHGDEAPQIPWMNVHLVRAVPIPPSQAMPREGPLGVIDGPEASGAPRKGSRSSKPRGGIVGVPDRAKARALPVRAFIRQ